MTISDPVTIPAGVAVFGAAKGQDVITSGRVVDLDPLDETVFTGTITLGNGVILDGVTLHEKPIIDANATSVTISNSRLVDITVPASGDHLQRAVIAIDNWNMPTKLVLDGNYFGTNTDVYNLFELNTPLADGTTISNNSFGAAANSHNIINIYAVETNANILIKDNYFAMSASAARIGIKGNEIATITFDGNEYAATDTTPNWGGLLTIQPYGTSTVSMTDITINISNTINNSGDPQLYVYYTGANDTVLADIDKPSVFIDGVLENWSSPANGIVLP